MWDLGCCCTPDLDILRQLDEFVGFDVTEEDKLAVEGVVANEERGGLVDPGCVAAMVYGNSSYGYAGMDSLVLFIRKKAVFGSILISETKRDGDAYVEYNNLWSSSSSSHEARLGHILSEKTLSRSSKVCFVA